ncbi:MAG: NAD-dependent epimerase/dehydratase family protein [Syntrophales bacterium]|nr:NAD-dependent epimerase/dehydratase family protein [Syntrophales bacterium]
MKIMITGVAGFIGANLAERLLRDGHRVIGIDSLAYGLRSNIPGGVDFHQLDIRGKEMYPLFAGTDAVFHFAAKNCIADCQADPVETADINVRGTVNVFEAARLGGVRKVIYAESSAIYEGAKTYPTPETDEAPESFYAMSKMASKYFAEAYARFYGTASAAAEPPPAVGQQPSATHPPACAPRHQPLATGKQPSAAHPPLSTGMRFTALRYFCVYGPVQDYRRTIPPVMSAFIIKLLKGEAPTIYGTGEKRRDFVYVDDINDFHVQCLTDPRTDNRVFNLGAGINYSVNEIYTFVSRLLNIHIPPVRRPDLPGEAQVTLADITAARTLGWQPRTDIETGLRNAIAYIRAEMEKGNI